MIRRTVAAMLLFFLTQPLLLAAESTAKVDRAVDLALEVVDLVLDRHIDPPARQQMLLDGMRSLYQRLEQPLPNGLARRVSTLAGKEQERAFLTETLQTIEIPAGQELEASLAEGLLTSVRGRASFIAAKEAEVQNQIRGNRYVGIGIALRTAEKGSGPTIMEPFPQGVAYKAGIRQDDQIIEVDGVATEGKKLAEVVDMLRGPEGTIVQLSIKRSTEAAPLAFTLRRSVVPFETVQGHRKGKDGSWDYRAGSSDAIGYVLISDVRASTVQELRQVEQRLRSQKTTCVVLDLRSNAGGSFHDTMLLADALLPEGVIGKARSPQGEDEFKSGADCLFRDWPMAVLINNATRGEAEWLAAALKDTRQAVLVGEPTPGHGFALEQVFLPSGRGAVELWTKTLLRADGTSLLHQHADISQQRPLAIDESRGSQPRSIGVIPDIKVEIGRQWQRSTTIRDRSAELPTDPQLEAAVRHLTRP